jgi:hypothetical protein
MSLSMTVDACTQEISGRTQRVEVLRLSLRLSSSLVRIPLVLALQRLPFSLSRGASLDRPPHLSLAGKGTGGQGQLQLRPHAGQSIRSESGALSPGAWSARSTMRSMFYLVLPVPTLTVDPF